MITNTSFAYFKEFRCHPLHRYVTVTFHLHNGVLRDVLAAGILLRFAPRFVVIVTRDEHHGAPLEPLEGPTLPFLRISVDVCLEICIERSKVGVLVRL